MKTVRGRKTGATLSLALCQIRGNNGTAARFPLLKRRIRAAAVRGARLVVLPELVFTPYFCVEEAIARFDLAQPPDHPQLRELASLAGELGVVLVTPFFERPARGIHFNSAAVFDADGRSLGLYRKMHIPNDPGFHEKYYFAPGDLGFRVFDTACGRISVLICWDQWFPEAARLAALQGAELIVYPTAIAWDRRELGGLSAGDRAALRRSQLDAWVTIQRAHAIANGCFVAAVNRVGVERHLEFWGNSFVANPRGEILGRLDSTGERTLRVDCALEEIDHTRKVWPFFRDRRVDAYRTLLRRSP